MKKYAKDQSFITSTTAVKSVKEVLVVIQQLSEQSNIKWIIYNAKKSDSGDKGVMSREQGRT